MSVIKIIGLVALVVVVIEVMLLLWLYFSVARYETFWQTRAEADGEITYLALGDSTAQGIGASIPMRGYVGLLADRIEEKTGKTIKIINISKTGANMEDYLRDQAPLVAGVQADIVTIEIGANDITKFDETTFRSSFKKVLETLPDGAYVSNMPVFNSRPGSGNKAKTASVIVEQEMKSYPKLVLVDLQKQTQENQTIFGFAPDLFHPNNISYKHWADAFWIQVQKNI